MEEQTRRKIPVITIALIAANVIVWLWMELTGDTQDAVYMLDHGAAYYPLITQEGEWWRLFTCMFLHFGAEHLIDNMLILYLTGSRMEHAAGRISYLLLYLGSGLCSSVLSLLAESRQTDWAVTAGASGAVFGIVGGLLAMAVLHRGQVEGLTTKGLLGMIGLSLIYGISVSGVDNWGHIGGFLGGLVLGVVLTLIQKVHIL